jgi:hypothetical protein
VAERARTGESRRKSQTGISDENVKHTRTTGGRGRGRMREERLGEDRRMGSIRENARVGMDGVRLGEHPEVGAGTEIGTVTHFLGKDVGDIVFATGVGDGNGAVGDPFLCCIFSVLNVTIPFGSHVVTPFDASVIVVVER